MRHVRRSGGNVGSESRLALASSSGSQHGVGALALRDLQVRTLPSADGFGVTGRAWRSSSVLQAECWTCMQCDVAYPHAILACGACGQPSEMQRSARDEDVQARARGAQDSSYGRKLRFLQLRDQHVGDIPSLGRFEDDNYDALVQTSVNEIGAVVWCGVRVRPSRLPHRGSPSLPRVLADRHQGQARVI